VDLYVKYNETRWYVVQYGSDIEVSLKRADCNRKVITVLLYKTWPEYKRNSMAFTPQANYTD
jgi:hypothetical protein